MCTQSSFSLIYLSTVVLLYTLVFQAGPLRQYENSPYAESNDAVHAGSAQTLAFIHLRGVVVGPHSRKVSFNLTLK